MITEVVITIPSGVGLPEAMLTLQSQTSDQLRADHATWLHSRPGEIGFHVRSPLGAASAHQGWWGMPRRKAAMGLRRCEIATTRMSSLLKLNRTGQGVVSVDTSLRMPCTRCARNERMLRWSCLSVRPHVLTPESLDGFYQALWGRYAIRDIRLLPSRFLSAVITTWRKNKLVRWKRH
jgi:hypothetical protein